MNNYISIFIPYLFLLLLSCAAHTNLEPVGKGNLSTNISIGGPFIKVFGTKIPVPYITSGLNYGLNQKTDLNGNLHLFPLAYQIFGLDAGSTWYPVTNSGIIPLIGIQPRLLTLISLKQNVKSRIKVYPLVSGNAAWKWFKGMIYSGSNIIVPTSSQNYDDDAPVMIISPFIGYRWNFIKNTFLYTEIKWHGANARSDKLAVEYLPLNNHGAISVFLSLERNF